MRKTATRANSGLSGTIRVIIFILVLAIIIAFMVYFYLQRYVVYTVDGAKLVLPSEISAQPDIEPLNEAEITAEVIIESPLPSDLSEAIGIADSHAAKGSFITVQRLLKTTAADDDILVVTVKTESGTLYYDSSIFHAINSTADIDGRVLKEKISQLKSQGVYLIAHISCFNDDYYAIANPNLALKGDDGLIYKDDNGSYWLDPSRKEVTDYLSEIAAELYNIGFDELLLDSFSYPPDVSEGLFGSLDDMNLNLDSAAERMLSKMGELNFRCSVIVPYSDLVLSDKAIVTRQSEPYFKRTFVLLNNPFVLEEVRAFGFEPENTAFITDSRDSYFNNFISISPN